MGYYKVDPAEDARKDVELQNSVLNQGNVFKSKKYYSKNHHAKIIRRLSLGVVFTISILLALAFFNIIDANDAQMNILLAIYSLLVSCIYFFVSLTLNYTEHQKIEYDFYFDLYSKQSSISSFGEETQKQVAASNPPPYTENEKDGDS